MLAVHTEIGGHVSNLWKEGTMGLRPFFSLPLLSDNSGIGAVVGFLCVIF